jgi:hypothetical protein
MMTGWVWFRARDFDHAVAFFASLAGVHGWSDLSMATHIVLNPAMLTALAIGGVLALVAVDARRMFYLLPRRIVGMARATADTLATILFFGVSLLNVAAGSYSPFLYFRF